MRLGFNLRVLCALRGKKKNLTTEDTEKHGEEKKKLCRVDFPPCPSVLSVVRKRI
jgi:hypothetical protein